MNILQDLRMGNENAFNTAYDIYHSKLYNYILSRTGSEYVAEEIVQIVFIKLWNNRNNLSEEFDLNIQLYRIAKTTLIDFIRKKEKIVTIRSVNASDNISAEEEIYSNVFFRDTSSQLASLIAKLPPVRKRVFEMSRYKNMSNKEISEQLSIAPKTVQNHLNLALKYIKGFFLSINFL